MKRRLFLFAAPLALPACAQLNEPADTEWWDRYERRAEIRRLARELEADRRAERRAWRRRR